jgi:serine/threonine-protein kinase
MMQAQTDDATILDSVHVCEQPRLRAPLIGRIIDRRYRVLDCLGKGGMGVVYRVQHVELGKILAIKVLSAGAGPDSTMAARFKREARLVSKLSDPHTVQVFDYGVSDGVTWMVMQLVSGSDLSRLLRKQGVFEAARVAQVVDGVCRSLSEAHSLGIVHRDIKPGNIMLTEADEAVVLDFGLAKLRDSRESNQLSARGTVIGTPGYMSPDQAMGSELDARADIYSLGAVMYRMLVGRAPFRGGTAAEMCLRQLQERPLSPHLARGVPIPLSDAVMRALEPEPDRRYQSAEALRRAVLAAAYQTDDDVVFPLVRRAS